MILSKPPWRRSKRKAARSDARRRITSCSNSIVVSSASRILLGHGPNVGVAKNTHCRYRRAAGSASTRDRQPRLELAADKTEVARHGMVRECEARKPLRA